MKKLLVSIILLLSFSFVNAQYDTNAYDTVKLNKCVKQTIYTIDLICYLQDKNMLDKKSNTISYINGSVFVNYKKVPIPKKFTKKLTNFEMRNISKSTQNNVVSAST